MTLADSVGAGDPELGRAEMRVLLDDAFGVLSVRDREVLRLRFGEDLTQTEISKRVGVSQMQVSRIIRQALGAPAVGHRAQDRTDRRRLALARGLSVGVHAVRRCR